MLTGLSIVIPAHNEGLNIQKFIDRFIHEMPADLAGIVDEIVVVENGSTDNTWQELQILKNRFPGLVRPISCREASYGEALSRGIRQAKGSHLAILECDFLDFSFVRQVVESFQETEVLFVLASKRHPGSRDLRPLKRRLLTALFNTVLRITLGFKGTDTRGLKGLETGLAVKLTNLALTSGELFQTELVLLAWKLGIQIVEVPIEIREIRSAPISVFRRLPMMAGMVRAFRRSLGRNLTLDE